MAKRQKPHKLIKKTTIKRFFLMQINIDLLFIASIISIFLEEIKLTSLFYKPPFKYRTAKITANHKTRNAGIFAKAELSISLS